MKGEVKSSASPIPGKGMEKADEGVLILQVRQTLAQVSQRLYFTLYILYLCLVISCVL